mgnify:CR=1 FL=1
MPIPHYNPNLSPTIFIKILSNTEKGLENNGLGENESQDGKGGERETGPYAAGDGAGW